MRILDLTQKEVEDLRLVGYSYVQQGIYDVALKIYETLTILAPSNAHDLETLGAIHLQLGNGLRALDAIDRSLKLKSVSLETRLNRAKALFLLGYRRQGALQAAELRHCEDQKIAAQALALIQSYGP